MNKKTYVPQHYYSKCKALLGLNKETTNYDFNLQRDMFTAIPLCIAYALFFHYLFAVV